MLWEFQKYSTENLDQVLGFVEELCSAVSEMDILPVGKMYQMTLQDEDEDLKARQKKLEQDVKGAMARIEKKLSRQ